MSQSKTKLLISGCGLSFSGSENGKTYTNILKLTGIPVEDVSGPAVSNQWIINRAFLKLIEDPEINTVILQLTSLGKLDVYVDENRMDALVKPDTLRNFTVENIWPSSASLEHESKRLWHEYLYSPELEQQDLIVKLLMLKSYCVVNGITLLIIQGYNLFWNETQAELLKDIMDTNYTIIEDYGHRLVEKEVPNMQFQFKLAIKIAELLIPEQTSKLKEIQQKFTKHYPQ